MLQVLGDKVPPDPLPGLHPWTLLGDFRPQTPSCVQYDFQTILGHAQTGLTATVQTVEAIK